MHYPFRKGSGAYYTQRGHRFSAHAAEFPESLVSDSKVRVPRLQTRLGLGLDVPGSPSLRLGIGLEVKFSLVSDLKLGLISTGFIWKMESQTRNTESLGLRLGIGLGIGLDVQTRLESDSESDSKSRTGQSQTRNRVSKMGTRETLSWTTRSPYSTARQYATKRSFMA